MTRHFVQSIFTLGIAQIITWLATASLIVVLPSYLGDENLGTLGIAMAVTGMLALLADVGTAPYLTREVARDPSRAGVLTSNALGMRFPLSAAATLLAVVFVNLVGYDEATKQIVYVFCGVLLIDSLAKVVLGALQGLQHMRSLAVGSVVGKVAFAGVALTLALSGEGGPFEVALIYLVGSLLSLSVGLFTLVRSGRLRLALDLSSWRPIFLGGLPFLAWQASLVIYGHIDVVLLSIFATHAVIGWYAAAYKIVMLPAFIPAIMMTVSFPTLAASAKDPAAFNVIARRAARFVLLLSIPMALGVMLLADQLIVAFRYPEAFANSVVLIVLLGPCLILASFDAVIGTVLNTRDRQRQWALTAAAAAVLNPLANLIAIPYTQSVYGNGAIGAAAITTLTEVFMMAVGLRLLPVGVFGRETLVYALKCLTVGLLMAGIVWVVRDYFLVVPILAGAVAYGAGCLAIGTLSTDHLREVARQLTARARPVVELKAEKLVQEP